MPTLQKFDALSQDLGRGVHDLDADALKVVLTNTAPAATDAVLADLTEIAAGNGYAAGGAAVASTAYAETSGTAKLAGNVVTFTASGGSVGPFRYAALYNTVPTSPLKPLIGWFDYGSSVTLADGESFNVAATTLGANWDATNPLLTLA